MVNPEYISLEQEAAEIIAEYGQPVTVTREVKGEYDPVTGHPDPITEIYELNGVLLNYTSADAGQGFEDGSIRKDDRKLLCEVTAKKTVGGIVTNGVEFKPDPSDKVTVSSGTYGVKNITTEEPGGYAIVHELQLRK